MRQPAGTAGGGGQPAGGTAAAACGGSPPIIAAAASAAAVTKGNRWPQVVTFLPACYRLPGLKSEVVTGKLLLTTTN